MTTRFERVQELIGDASTNALVVVYGENQNYGFYVSCTTETFDNEFCITFEPFDDNKDKVEFEKIHISNVNELRKLRDFLNYWLEEVKPESAVVTSKIDPIFMESTAEIFKKCVSKRSINYYGIHTIGQLVRKTPGNLMHELRYFSYGKLNKITQRLADKGLWLGMTEEDIRNWKPLEGDSK